MRKFSVLYITLFLLTIPMVLFANSGTVLMWSTAIHLLLGNFFIGLLEAKVLSKLYGLKFSKLAFFMVPANYFSAFAGFPLVALTSDYFSMRTLEPLWWLIFLSLPVSFLLTVLLESPFIWFLIRKSKSTRRKYLAFLIPQLVSYAILVPLYCFSSNFSVYTTSRMVDFSSIHNHPEYTLLYIDQPRKNICSMPLKFPLQGTRIYALEDTHSYPTISVETGSTSKTLNLSYVIERDQVSVVLEDFATAEFDSEQSLLLLPSFEDCEYRFHASKWNPQTGLRFAKNEDPYKNLALETPFAILRLTNIQQIACHRLVFQFGDAIYLFDMETSDLAKITDGISPLVLKTDLLINQFD